MSEKIKIGITQGDINGINYEVIIKALADHLLLDICTPVIYGSSKAASFYKKELDIPTFNYNVIPKASEANSKRINIINCTQGEISVTPGQIATSAGDMAKAAFEMGLNDLKKGFIDALLAMPVDRRTTNVNGYKELLEEEFSLKSQCLPLLISEQIRVATIFGKDDLMRPLEKGVLTQKIRTFHKVLIEDFAVRKPRIAIIRTTADETISTEIKDLNNEGLVCLEVTDAKAFFEEREYIKFDGVILLSYEQLNSIDTDQWVVYFSNLPIICTAPNHGVEYEKAGQNIASEDSFRNAIYLACDLQKDRQLYKEISLNPLKATSQKSEHQKRAD
jgi:4-hydroxythreonine-4-phosphate dehydrogenase